ncbi:MAG TPA: hypothetical protein VE201_03175 [Nitrospirales bacterium]|nr:hypothetical protein [Nitrospirales bacterium]
MATTCVYCHTRKGKRSCPALSGLICSTCCGENRLTKINCPADCPYLEAGTDYQRQRVGELFRQDRRRVYREVFEIGGEKAAGLFNLIEIVCFSYFHNKPSGLDGEVIAALEFIRRLLSPIHFPAPTVPAFSQYLHKEFKAFLEKEKVDQTQAQQIVDLAIKLGNEFSGTGLRSNRFITGLIGCLTMDHPEVAEYVKRQDTDQPRIVLAGEEDIAAAAKAQAQREKSRIVLPGAPAHTHDHEHHGHKHS